ncbi:MAG: TetR/AcrR family transcriptional regulator [Erysipelotrichaceae bacterium]|nr:TetR/AcrR family transcriptional regulator [Erysipelotrichaceae bacterium]
MEDVRIRKTKQVIRSSLLKLLLKKQFQEISILELCKEAKISRMSFYKNYGNTRMAMEETIDELIEETIDLADEFFACINGKNIKKQRPMCDLIRKDMRFLPIIKDEELTRIFIERMTFKISDETVKAVAKLGELSPSQIRTLFEFQLCGCIMSVRNSYDLSDEQWRKKKKAIDEFLKKGYSII